MKKKPPFTGSDSDLPGVEKLSRLYQVATREEPPSRRDRQILDEASKTQAKAPKPTRRQFNFWVAPVSLAAVVILSVTVVLFMSQEDINPLQPSANKVSRPVSDSAMKRAPEQAPEVKQEITVPREPSAYTTEEPARKKETQMPGSVSSQNEKSVVQDAATAADSAPSGIATQKLRRSTNLAPQGLSAPQVAPATSSLPADVMRFKERRDLCDHFRGEEPYSAERKRFLEENLNKYCTGTDEELASLKAKYQSSQPVLNLLAGYETKIEEGK